MRNHAKEKTASRSDAISGTEALPSSGRKRLFWIILLILFVVLGVSAIIYLMAFRLPTQYRQQAARMIAPTIRASEVGDMVFFGTYEQDNDESNGTEPIEWIVLDKMNDRLLLMCRYGLDCVRFNAVAAFVTWDESSILTWLNNTFYYSAFNGAERSMILRSEQKTDLNPYFDTDPGKDTTERVFLANITQIAKYLPSDESRMCVATPYATEQGVVTEKETGNCVWWLRSPGFDASASTRVLLDGRINYCGYLVHSNRQAVRPWMWIALDPNQEITEE